MKRILERLDMIAEVTQHSLSAKWLERAAFLSILLMALSAPHSIAATQTAWLVGLVCWAARMFIKPRPAFRFRWIDAALLSFVGWTILSSFLSYEPAISLDKLRGVGLFLILYLVTCNLRSMRAVVLVAAVLITSCMFNVVLVPLERIVGRGVEIYGVRPDGAFAKAGLANGDAILKVNGKKVSTPEEILAEITKTESASLLLHRPDSYPSRTIRRVDLPQAATVFDSLGFESWKKNHKWRAMGFYGHFTTYSEVLQLVGSLVLGLLIAGFFAAIRTNIPGTAPADRLFSKRNAILAICLVLISLALLLTGTRASQLGMMASAFAMVVSIGNRKLVFAMFLIAIPVSLAGYLVIQQTRQPGETNEYRKMMWRDGVRLATEKPRHLLVGVGMDSLKKRWPEWGLFDGGNMPMGHFHSTPVQLAAERGLPALMLWIAFLALLARTLWRGLKRSVNSIQSGIILGGIGGLVGFVTAGMVHYNLGDGEVAMVFYLIAGAALAASRFTDLDTRSADPMPDISLRTAA